MWNIPMDLKRGTLMRISCLRDIPGYLRHGCMSATEDNWNINDVEGSERSEEPLAPEAETLDCPADVRIICCGLSDHSASNPPHKFPPPRRKDSLRRPLIDSHLTCARNGISCTWAACHSVPKFTEVTEFLAHAVTAQV